MKITAPPGGLLQYGALLEIFGSFIAGQNITEVLNTHTTNTYNEHMH